MVLYFANLGKQVLGCSPGDKSIATAFFDSKNSQKFKSNFIVSSIGDNR